MNKLTMPDLPRGKPSDAIVYAAGEIGHRRSYVGTLARMLGYSPSISSLNTEVASRLVRADRLVIATFDDSPAIYALIALLRGFLGRRTAALFLRPQTCLRTDHVKYRLKKLFYRAVRLIPGLTLVTITPHEWKPSLAQVSHVGTYDPQYWDFHDGTRLRAPRHSAFSRDLAAASDGRNIISLPGFISREKGFELLTHIAATQAMAQAPVLIVAAGAVLPEMRSTAEAFERAGGMLVDRELSDDEIESLYGVSTAVWACYIPDYDQASGIFGRSFQAGTPVLVREGSLIAAAAQDLGAQALALPFDDQQAAAATIIEWIARKSAENRTAVDRTGPTQKVGALREHFVHTIRSALKESGD